VHVKYVDTQTISLLKRPQHTRTYIPYTQLIVRRVTRGQKHQGRSDGGYMGIYTPKISPSKLFLG